MAGRCPLPPTPPPLRPPLRPPCAPDRHTLPSPYNPRPTPPGRPPISQSSRPSHPPAVYRTPQQPPPPRAAPQALQYPPHSPHMPPSMESQPPHLPQARACLAQPSAFPVHTLYPRPAPLPSSGKTPLDAHQSVCVLADPTQNMVVHACPGAGKSTTIARRCQALVERGVPPSRILVLTFSKASAIDLDTKMSQLGGMMPRATTYHAFALKVLRKLPGPHSSSSIIQPGQQRKLLRKLLPQGDPSQSKQLLKRAISVVSKTKASDATLAKADPQVAELLRRYDEELRRGNLIDFEDMITLTTRAIQAEEARSGQPFSPFHSHLLLDEAQDTSTGQLALLKAIAPVGGITLTAVGDADQTIYGFRGSRPDMLACIASYWGCTAFLLPNNYRCAPPIVYASRMIVDGASAHANLEPEGVDVHGVLRTSARGDGVRLDSFGSGCMDAVGVRMVRCAQRADELEGLARELLQRSSTRGTAAVLCRLRAECTQVRTVLKEFGVPLIAAEERSAWNKGQEGLGLLSFLRLATTPSDDAAFTVAIGVHSHTAATFGRKGAAMAYLRGLQEPGGLLKAARAAKLRGFPQCKAQSNLTRPAQSALTQFLETMDDICRCVQSPEPIRVDGLLASLAERVRFAVHLTKQDARGASSRRAFSVSTRESPPQQGHSSLDDSDDDESETDVGTARVNKLLKLASRVAASLDPAASNIEHVAQFCDAMALASHDSASSPAKEEDEHAVVVSTIHQAKGLEWDVVYIPGLTDGVIPLVPRGLLPNSLELVEHYEEERRLMYVAITRARRSLVLSWPEKDEPSHPSEGAGAQQKQRASALKPSRFLSQLLSACEAGPGGPSQQVTLHTNRSETHAMSRAHQLIDANTPQALRHPHPIDANARQPMSHTHHIQANVQQTMIRTHHIDANTYQPMNFTHHVEANTQQATSRARHQHAAPQIPPPAARTLWHDYPQPMETCHAALPRHAPTAAGTSTSFPAPQTRWQDYTLESARPGLSGAWTGFESRSAVCPRGSKRPMPPM